MIEVLIFAGTIRTINTVSQLDIVLIYQIPKTEDLLVTLAGGQIFSKVDLSIAYSQIELEEQSQDNLTINSHKGLFDCHMV